MTLQQGQKGKFSNGNSSIRKALGAAVSGLTVAACQRGSGLLVKGDQGLRIDMQGTTSNGAFNLQAQIGSSSYAGVFLAATATNSSDADLQNGFLQSYDSGCFYLVS